MRSSLPLNQNLDTVYVCMTASWRKRLDTRLPQPGSRAHISLTPCGFHGGRNWVWVGFSRGFSSFPLPQISFHHFSTVISYISFDFISPYDGATGVVGRHSCYSLTFKLGASSHLIPRPGPVSDTSWRHCNLFICGSENKLECVIQLRGPTEKKAHATYIAILSSFFKIFRKCLILNKCYPIFDNN